VSQVDDKRVNKGLMARAIGGPSGSYARMFEAIDSLVCFGNDVAQRAPFATGSWTSFPSLVAGKPMKLRLDIWWS
jgi:hypothetical protein